MKYNKLVRDKIPEITKQEGKTPVFHIASDQEYEEMLKKKLREEVSEFIADRNVEELADILEVMDAFCALHHTDMDYLLRLKKEKAEKRGSFTKKIVLDEIK